MTVRMSVDEFGKSRCLEPQKAPVEFDETPPEALRAVYERLPDDVMDFCEGHRIGMMRDMLGHLKAVRDKLAPYGEFKQWCAAAGVNYKTVANALTESEHPRKHIKRTVPPGGIERSLYSSSSPRAKPEPKRQFQPEPPASRIVNAESREEDDADEPEEPTGDEPEWQTRERDESRLAAQRERERKDRMSGQIGGAVAQLKRPRYFATNEEQARHLLGLVDFERTGQTIEDVISAGEVLIAMGQLLKKGAGNAAAE